MPYDKFHTDVFRENYIVRLMPKSNILSVFVCIHIYTHTQRNSQKNLIWKDPPDLICSDPCSK